MDGRAYSINTTHTIHRRSSDLKTSARFLRSSTSSSSSSSSSPMDHSSKAQKPHASDLLSGAKVVAGAAKAVAHHETDKIDKGKVAGAAADLLGAASHYGKLEEKGVGKYVRKAENYLDKHRPTNTTSTHTQDGGEAHAAGSHDGAHHSGGGKHGDYIKMAEGLLKKH